MNPQTEIYAPGWIPSPAYGGADRATWARHARAVAGAAAVDARWRNGRDYLDAWDIFGAQTQAPYASWGAGHDPRTGKTAAASLTEQARDERAHREELTDEA